MSIRNNPFVVDGPVPPDSDVYIERSADLQLREACRDGEIVNVPASPRMGKTSLMFRTHEWLREQGARCVIDPRPVTEGSDEEWYEKFVSLLIGELRLKFDGRNWWKERQDLELTDRLLGLFEEIALETGRQIVIFIDDFETLNPKALDVVFLRFIRKFHKKRTRNRSLRRISLILFSSTRLDLNRVEEGFPPELIRTLLLTDFTLGEAQRLANAFRIGAETEAEFLRKAFEWTEGHPYLTQRACYEIFEALPLESFDGPETPIREYFLNNRSDPQLEYIRSVLRTTSVLKEYQRFVTGTRSTLDVFSNAYMMNNGLLKPGRPTQVRNRVYREVFNEKWVEEQLREKESEDLFDGQDLSERPGGFTVADRYRLERRLERGTAGDIYLTKDQKLGKDVAIRLIPSRYLTTEDDLDNLAIKSWVDTLRGLATISNPNIVPIFDFGFSADLRYLYLVTEYLQPLSISTLDRSIEEVLQILSDVVNAVDTAHLAGRLHLDLTPSKLYTSADSTFPVKVSDLGMARLLNKGPRGRPSRFPRQGEVGDPVYMAPEQIYLDGHLDPRADVYALGMIAYLLFGGQVPQSENLPDILRIKQEKRFVSLRKLREGIPEAAERAIMRALEVEPNDRPSSAREWFDEVSAAFQTPPRTVETDQPPASGNFEFPIVVVSQFTVDDPETQTVKFVIARTRETLFGGMKFIPYDTNTTDLRGVVFVGVIRQSYTFSEYTLIYEEAKRYALKTLIYIKREDRETPPRRSPRVLSRSAFEELKKEMLADGAARFFDTADELDKLFSTDLIDWLSDQFLPRALEEARQSSSEVITELLNAIKDPEVVDEKLLDEVRKQQVASTGRYWFYLSCAQEDWSDGEVKRFFQRLNNEVRTIAGASDFYVGAFRPSGSDVATTALREEWFPHTLAALQNSRVLVPLYTPNYFKNEVCGKVWEFFRLRTIADNTPAPIILPVLWSPNNDLPDPLPHAVASIQYTDDRGSIGWMYSSRGLRQLRKRDHDQYEEFIKSFAQRLFDVATSYPVQPLSEPPAYAEITNAFAVEAETATTEDRTPHPSPPKRWIMVANSVGAEVAENVLRVAFALAREIARRGYGLAVFGRGSADHTMRVGFAQVVGDEARFKRAVKFINNPDAPGAISTPSSDRRYENDIEEMMKQCDVVVILGGEPNPYEHYGRAERLHKPVFPIPQSGETATQIFRRAAELAPEQLPAQVSVSEYQKLDHPLETEADARHMSRTLLDMIDSLWLSPTTPQTTEEALSGIAFMEGNLIGVPADAIVHPVGMDPTDYGEVGEELLERLGYRFREQLESQGPLTTGETLITRTESRLSATYVIHVCLESYSEVGRANSPVEAIKGALKRADLLELKTVAFPSLETRVFGADVKTVAPMVLRAVVDHLLQGSRLQTVLFVFKTESDYEAYLKAFFAIGGKPSYRVLLLYFDKRALAALRLAESARERLGRERISSSLLLWGLYQIEAGATEDLLLASNTNAAVYMAFLERLGITDESLLSKVEPASHSAMAFASFTPHCDEALLKAKDLAGSARISDRHLLAGLLSIPEAHGTKWLAEMMGIPASELYEIVAVHGDEPGKSITDEIANRREQQVSVATTAWTISLTPPQLNGQDLNELRVGERVTFTISLDAIIAAETSKNTLRIPANSLELTGWIRAPGCQLPLEIPFTIKTIDGLPETKTFSFDLKPLLSGPRTVEIELYPGGHVSNLGPAIVTRAFSVASPIVLPDIKELIDRRQIPNPQPDVMLYVALQETPTHQQTQIYLTCAALQLDREPLEPALPLNESDIAELRRFAVESAAKASGLSPPMHSRLCGVWAPNYSIA